jgi:hypothetical protein
LNPEAPDHAIKEAWIKTPEGRQMSDQLRAMEWKVLLLSLTSAHLEWQADFGALKPGQDHSALRQEAAKHLSDTEAMFKSLKSTFAKADLKEMERHLGGSQKLNSQLTEAMTSHISLMRAGLKYLDNLPKPEHKHSLDDDAAYLNFAAFMLQAAGEMNPSAGTAVKIKDASAFEEAPIKHNAAQLANSSIESSPDEHKLTDVEFQANMIDQMMQMGFLSEDDDSDAGSSHSSIA